MGQRSPGFVSDLQASVAPGLRSSLEATGVDAALSPGSSDDEVVNLLGDTRPDRRGGTPKTIWGFYGYSVACEVFAIVSLSLFLPVCLEQLARENGRLAPAFLLPCPPSSSSTTRPDGDAERCAVRILGSWIDTASFSLYTYSASVAVQAACVISLGALADNPRTRHRLLSFFAAVGSVLTMSFLVLPSSSPIWPLSSLLALGANVSFGCSMVCLNSYLPDLGRRNPAVLQKLELLEDATEDLKAIRSSPNPSGDALLVASQALARAQDEYVMERALATSVISSRAVASGYASGILALLLLLVPVTLMKGSTLSLQLAICGSGAWWAIGSVPALYWLRPASGTAVAPSAGKKGVLRQAAEGWKGLGFMLKEWRRLPATFVFLGAWFLLSDAMSTLTSTAMLFGKTSLGMSTSSLVLIAVISPMSGIGGAVLFPHLQSVFLRCGNLKVLVLLVCLACLVPVWGLLALRSKWQMYALAVVFGGVYGSFQSYARTCFSELVPTSQAARWFGLYSITDKSSSFLGPLLVALITNYSGNIRHGFILILGMLLTALPILASVDMSRGRADAEIYDRHLLAPGLGVDED